MAWMLISLVLLTAGLPGAAVLEQAIDGAGGNVPGTPVAQPDLPLTDVVTLSAGALATSVLLTGLIAAGTKHVTRDNVLEHEARRKMYELLWESGPMHLRRLATTLELSTTNATWHLDKLVKAGLVGEVKANGYRMYYPRGAGRIVRDQCLLTAQMQSENARAVVEYLADHPGAHQREVARALEVNHGTARWHLTRLAEAGVLEVERDGRAVSYALTPEASEAFRRGPLAPSTAPA